MRKRSNLKLFCGKSIFCRVSQKKNLALLQDKNLPGQFVEVGKKFGLKYSRSGPLID